MNGFISLADSFNIKGGFFDRYFKIIKTREQKCNIHGDYTDELVNMPPNKSTKFEYQVWSGCKKCKQEKYEKERVLQIQADMANRGMIWDNESKRFVDKNSPVAANDEQSKVTKFRFRG